MSMFIVYVHACTCEWYNHLCYSTYRLIVSVPERTKERRKRDTIFNSCNLEKLYGYTAAVELELTCYIAAEIKGSRVTEDGLLFFLGDESTNGGYLNVPLEANIDYNMTVGAIVYAEVSTYIFVACEDELHIIDSMMILHRIGDTWCNFSKCCEKVSVPFLYYFLLIAHQALEDLIYATIKMKSHEYTSTIELH